MTSRRTTPVEIPTVNNVRRAMVVNNEQLTSRQDHTVRSLPPLHDSTTSPLSTGFGHLFTVVAALSIPRSLSGGNVSRCTCIDLTGSSPTGRTVGALQTAGKTLGLTTFAVKPRIRRPRTTSDYTSRYKTVQHGIQFCLIHRSQR